MRRFATVVALVGFLNFTITVSAQSKTSEEYLQDLPIYSYQGLERNLNQVWLVFDVWYHEKELRTAWVPPEKITLELRSDKKHYTSLSVVFCSPHASPAKSAVLRVPTEHDLSKWEKYLADAAKSLTAKGLIKKAELFYQNNHGGRIIIDTSIVNKNFGEEEHNFIDCITQVRVGVDKIEIIKMGSELANEQSNDEIRLVIDYGLAHVMIERNNNILTQFIDADAATICVASDEQLDEWQQKISDWQKQCQPHRVLPPSESSK